MCDIDGKVVNINHILSKIPGLYLLCKSCELNIISQTQIKHLQPENTPQEINESIPNKDFIEKPDHINVITLSPKSTPSENQKNNAPIVDSVDPNIEQIDTPFRSRRLELMQQRESNLNMPLTHQESTYSLPQISESTQALPETTQSVESHEQEQKNSDQSDANKSKSKSLAKTKICSFYQKGNCRFGLSGKKGGICKFAHPKACAKLLKHGTHPTLGCNKGKYCEKYHPKMCFDSIKTKKCGDSSCKFVHVKGTNKTPNNPLTNPPNVRISTDRNTQERNPVITNSNDTQSFLESALHCLMKTMESKMEARLSLITQKLEGLISHQTSNIRAFQQPIHAQLNQQLPTHPQWNPYPLMPHLQQTIPRNQQMFKQN